ncbi:MAG: NIPSNAP family protein [Siphonobacter sp.]
MRVFLQLLLAVVFLSGFTTPPDGRLYEMRVYYSPEGKFPDILARFRNHTTKLFEKHGMTNVGYFVPEHKPDSCLIYFLSYPNKAARDSSWKAFNNDPEWKRVSTESEKNGKIVSKVESYFLHTTDFSPALQISQKGNRVFQLRTYKTGPYNLPLLLARFRNHTVKLFEKHGMTNFIYWTRDDANDMLVYLLAHPSRQAGEEEFKAFRADPDWIAVRTASEKLANGSLTEWVRAIYLIPTDFSPLK